MRDGFVFEDVYGNTKEDLAATGTTRVIYHAKYYGGGGNGRWGKNLKRKLGKKIKGKE